MHLINKWALMLVGLAVVMLLGGVGRALDVRAQSAVTQRLFLPASLRGATFGGAVPAAAIDSIGAIDQAVQRGAIDPETALLYKTYVVFGDARLPAEYRGDNSRVHAGAVIGDVVARYATLSDPARAALEPFLVPPVYPGSWASPRTAAATGTRQAAASAKPLCDFVPQWLEEVGWNYNNAPGWHYYDRPAGPARFWVQQEAGVGSDQHRAAEQASLLMEGLWSRMSILMNRTPLSDHNSWCAAGTGKLDIFLVPLGGDRGLTINHGIGCEKDSVFILLERSLRGPELQAALIHELMHATQWSYDVGSFCMKSEYGWLMEATATWAVDYIDTAMSDVETGQFEHRFAPEFLGVPEQPLEANAGPTDYHPYGAYLFPFWLARTMGPETVRHLWEAAERHSDSLQAVNSVLTGGFAEQWPKFVLRGLNRPPVDEFNRWDELTAQAELSLNGAVDLGDAPDAQLKLEPADVPHLAARYYRFTFPHDSARTVAFYNGFTFNLSRGEPSTSSAQYGETYFADPVDPAERKGIKVQALVKIAGRDWAVEDWTEEPIKAFCRDARAERLEELILVVSNSEHADRGYTFQPRGLAPTLWGSNLGCWRWRGTGQSRITTDQEYGLVRVRSNASIDATVTWERIPPEVRLDADGYYLTATRFRQSGQASWRETGEREERVLERTCTWSMSGTTPLSPDEGELTLYNFLVTPGVGSYRAHEAFGAVSSSEPSTDSCGEEGSFSQNWIDPSPNPVHASADGTVLSGSNPLVIPILRVDQSWSFTAEREP